MAGKSGSMSSHSKAQNPLRRYVVFAALAGSLTLTGLGLQVLSPPPVRAPDTPDRLFSSQPIERVTAKLDSQRVWKSIYIRHSKTQDGQSPYFPDDEIADHFVISAAPGGECEVLVSPRWKSQQSALPPRGAKSLSSDCVSICLVGDFDRTPPSRGQVERLAQLVNSLQVQHRIPGSAVFWMNLPGSPIGLGKQFPADEFRKHVLVRP